jgi:hypothetical protein
VNTPDHVGAAVLAKAEAEGVHGAELAALRRRLRQLGERQAGLLPGEVLEPLADLPRLDELPEPSPVEARGVLDRLVVVKLNSGQRPKPLPVDTVLGRNGRRLRQHFLAGVHAYGANELGNLVRSHAAKLGQGTRSAWPLDP